MHWKSSFSAVTLCCLLAGCGSETHRTFTDLRGGMHRPLQVAPGKIHVLVFVTTDCPIANSYAPLLRELSEEWLGSNVQLFVVHVEPDTTVALARQHADMYNLPNPVLIDPRQELASALKVRATPEAVVLTAKGTQYQGRIDDAWGELGTKRNASAQDLVNAVDAVRQGRKPLPAKTEVVGCLLPVPRK